ncbi:hypothetical protein QQG55_52930 [Brugia pahangi]
MAGNFDTEALVLIVLTYITLIIILLRLALALCQFTIKKEIDRAKQIREQSLSLQKVTVIDANNENKQNSNGNHLSSFNSKNKYHDKPIKNHNSSYNENFETILLDSSIEDINVNPIIKHAYPSITQSHQKGVKRVNEDESFWLHSFEESELSRENANIPHTSAYGMRKVGKKTYIDDTNIGSPGSKALEQKSCEHIEYKRKCNAMRRNAK